METKLETTLPVGETVLRNATAELRLDRERGIATILLCSESGVNRIDEGFAAGLREAFGSALAWPECRGIVIGTALRDFCLGATPTHR